MAVPLWIKSNGSFLAATSHPEELVATAKQQGHQAMALTDRFGLYGAAKAHQAAKQHGIKLIVGAELLADAAPVVLLAPDRLAYGRLCQLLSMAQLAAHKGCARLAAHELAQLLAAGGEGPGALIALCPSPALLLRLAGKVSPKQLYGLCVRHGLRDEPAREAAMQRLALSHGLPLAAATEVLYHTAERRALLDVVRCIETRHTLASAGPLLRANANHAMLSPAALHTLFADRPKWLAATEDIAARCHFQLSDLHYRYPVQRLPLGHQQHDELAARVATGLRERLASRCNKKLLAQAAEELSIIRSLDYDGYFLSMQDIVRFCRTQNILCQGRGSAANSVVCYALGITAVDPTKVELLFSRFLSKARAEPPDIDLDIEHHRREEVLQWVYRQYGRSHAAMVANVVRFRWRSAVKEVGLVLGLPPDSLMRLGKRIGYAGEAHPGASAQAIDWRASLQDANLSVSDARVGHLLRLANALRQTPRYLSVHPGGFVLGNEPIDTLCAVEPASMPGRTVLQWDKQDIDDLGLFKVDLLGLGALHQIHLTFDAIASSERKQFTLANLPSADAATYAMLQRAESIGVFQVESRAQMSMLPRLKPAQFYDLVVQVAIVRPGPIQGDMVHPYLRQRELGAPIVYPHPRINSILDKTFGVPIFQEQVMQLAISLAGYAPDEADALRRDMAAWRSQERLEAHHHRITESMCLAGMERSFAERLFAQIRGFGEYGFPESHAASFAHIVYATAYLRCHYFAAFVCGLLNAQPMGFYTPATIMGDALRRGLVVLPVDVTTSAWDCTLVAGEQPGPHRFCVRMGIKFVHHLGLREQQQLALAPPPYRSLADFVRRTKLNRRALRSLVQAGALDALLAEPSSPAPHPGRASVPQSQLGPRRREIWWHVETMLAAAADSLPMPQAEVPAAWTPLLAPLALHERICWDVEASGHSTCGHPLAGWRQRLHAAGWLRTAATAAGRDGARAACAGQVICRQRPETAKGILFLTLEDESGLLNVIVRPQVQARYADVAAHGKVVGVRGELQSAHGSVHLLADELVQLL